MADAELVRILKEEGVEAWNRFVAEQRAEDSAWRADLRGANLSGANLGGVNLCGVNLRGAKLGGATLAHARLRGANLRSANLGKADLFRADLHCANLITADLIRANLSYANLSGADLYPADLFGADLRHANLSGADLRRARLSSTDLRDANLTDAELRCAELGSADLSHADLSRADLTRTGFGGTVFGRIDLSAATGLDRAHHDAGSTVGADTLALSKGEIPPEFLRGCGLADWEVENAKLYNLGLSAAAVTDIQYEVFRLRTTGPIQVNPVFLSHSHEDHETVEKLHDTLQADGIRCWLDTHRMTAGPLDEQIDRAIQTHPTVVLVLSKHSVESDWVMWEAKKARELEKKSKRPALCPIALDRAWEDCNWPETLRTQIERYHIVPFDDLGFDEGYLRLRDGLGIYYPQGPPSG